MLGDRPGGVRFGRLRGGWVVGRIPLLTELPGFRHAITTRTGPRGGSLAEADPAGEGNRRRLRRALGVEAVVTARQVHGSTVVDADLAADTPTEADAIMTDRPGVALLGLSADCPIVLVADPVTGAVGMAHASWRGTVAGVTGELIAAMRRTYHCDPAEMRAGICPSAGACCYEVGDDVVAAVRGAFGEEADRLLPASEGRVTFDLWGANIEQLTAAGLTRHNVAVAGVCTICDRRFFSYRREGAATGRFGGVIARI